MFAESAIYICNFNGKIFLAEFEPNNVFFKIMEEKINEAKK